MRGPLRLDVRGLEVEMKPVAEVQIAFDGYFEKRTSAASTCA
jgi:hypothetical protein